VALTSREVFDLVATQAFAKLLGEFPVPCDLNADHFAGPLVQNGGEMTTEDHIRIYHAARDTISFLKGAGLIDVINHPQTLSGPSAQFFGVRLTMEGLALLGTVPTSLGSSLGDQLSTVANDGAKAAATAVIQSLFQTAIGMGLRTIGMAGP
jgi:hypothetical protein